MPLLARLGVEAMSRTYAADDVETIRRRMEEIAEAKREAQREVERQRALDGNVELQCSSTRCVCGKCALLEDPYRWSTF